MFGFGFHRRRPDRRPLLPPAAHVVARVVPAAPCGWVFFDGSETSMTAEDGTEFIVPGGGFFPKEARQFGSESDARDTASRLNDAGPCLDRPWRAKPAYVFQIERVHVFSPARTAVRA